MRWGYKKSREIVRRMKLYRGEYSSAHPKFPAGSAAEAKQSQGPVAIDSPDIAYTKDDDEAIDEFHRAIATTGFHSVNCTCTFFLDYSYS
jgi:alcohol oxidase